jgi:hypothetical protein
MYGDELVCNLLETVINYKFNIRFYKYLDAWGNFQDIFVILGLDDYDLNTYFHSGGQNNIEGHFAPTRRLTAGSVQSDLEEIQIRMNNKNPAHDRQNSFNMR